MSNKRGAGGAPSAAAAGAAEDENNPRNAKRTRPDSSSMASLLHKYRREFAVPFAINHDSINHDSNKEDDYCSTTNEEGDTSCMQDYTCYIESTFFIH
jgi:myb proto-oncogene protein